MFNILPDHQGSAVERHIYGNLGSQCKVFLSSVHLNPNRANIDFTGAYELGLMSEEGFDLTTLYGFKAIDEIEYILIKNEYIKLVVTRSVYIQSHTAIPKHLSF